MCRIEFSGVQGFSPAGGAGVTPEKPFFLFLAPPAAVRGNRREAGDNSLDRDVPLHPDKGRAAPCNPASQADQKVGITHVN